MVIYIIIIFILFFFVDELINMKVQLENRAEIRLNCLSKSMTDIKTQVSRRFNIAPNTFFLFYQDQPIFKMLDSYNDKIIFVKEFLPIKFLPNEDPNLIYSKIRLRPITVICAD